MLGVVLAVGGLVAVVIGGWKLRPAYYVYRGDTDDVVDVERIDRPIELEGTATPLEETVGGPLTDTPCLAYEYEVEEYQSSGNNTSAWNTVDSGAGGVPFRLEDETASVRVDPMGAEFALSTHRTIEVDGGNAEPEPIRAFLSTESDLESADTSLDLGVIEFATGNDRRYHERRLEPGESVYVFGQSRYDVDARETMRDVNAVIEDGPETPVFVVGDASQDDTAWRLAEPTLVWFVGGLAAIVIGFWLSLPGLLG